MSGNEREPRNPWLVAGVQVLFWIGAFTGAAWFSTGLLSGRIHPAEFLTKLPHYRDVFVHALAPTLSAVVAVAALIAVAGLILRLRRVWATSGASPRLAARVWRYRRRWRTVLAAHGLTETETHTRRVRVPALHAIALGAHADTLHVAPLPGQSPGDWDARAARLAAAFGAIDGRVASVDAHGVIGLEFARGPRQRLALAAAIPPATPAPGQRPELVAIVRGWSLRVSWARVRVYAHDGTYQTRRYRNRARWSIQGMQFRTMIRQGATI